MDSDENFHSNHLRLAAFLRVVEHVPQRPTRFQQRASNDGNGHATSQYPLQCDHHKDASEFSVADVKPEMCSLAPSQYLISAANPAVDVHGPRQDVALIDSKIDVGSVSFRSKAIRLASPQDDSSAAKKYPMQAKPKILGLIRRQQKGLVVFATKKKPMEKTPTARKQQMSSVNELALMRTTSNDGLPVPSVRVVNSPN